MAKKQDSVLFEMCELDCEGLVLELNMLGQLAGLQEGVQILLEVALSGRRHRDKPHEGRWDGSLASFMAVARTPSKNGRGPACVLGLGFRLFLPFLGLTSLCLSNSLVSAFGSARR